jgi:tRNA(His) 5'-end guanylyltransferase
MAAQSMFSHNELMHKNTAEKQEMMFQTFGINFNDYSDSQKRGTYIQNRKVETNFLPEEIEKLPKNHMARTNPELLVIRNRIEVLKMPPISKLTNGVEVIFHGAIPKVAT